MERCIKSIKEELGSLHGYQDMTKLYLGISKAIDYYNTERIHTALKMAPRLSYLHIKDYIISDGLKKYVPAGEGEVGYDSVLAKIFKYCDNDLVLTVETHAQNSKIEMSARAISGTRLLLSKQGVNL